MTPPSDWVNAVESMTHSGGFGGSGKCPMIGDESGTFLGFLKSTWKGGYLQRHSRSTSARIMRAAHNYIFFGFYELLKSVFRRLRKKFIYKQAKMK